MPLQMLIPMGLADIPTPAQASSDLRFSPEYLAALYYLANCCGLGEGLEYTGGGGRGGVYINILGGNPH